MTKYSAKPLPTLLLVVEIGRRKMGKEEKVVFTRAKPHD
jgi:hypothetical protein